MSKIKNGGLDQYGAGPFEQQQFGTAGVEGVNDVNKDQPMISGDGWAGRAFTIRHCAMSFCQVPDQTADIIGA